MKKEITIPEATVTVETKYTVTEYAYERDISRSVSPAFNTYTEAETWIAQKLAGDTAYRYFKIEATHGRFAE